MNGNVCGVDPISNHRTRRKYSVAGLVPIHITINQRGREMNDKPAFYAIGEMQRQTIMELAGRMQDTTEKLRAIKQSLHVLETELNAHGKDLRLLAHYMTSVKGVEK